MAKKNNDWYPTTFQGWLTVFSLAVGIVSVLYSGVVKPYNSIRSVETCMVEVKKDIAYLRTDIDRLMLKIYK